MKADLDIIKAPINEHLKAFDKLFKDSMKSNVSLLDIITRYIVKSKGKQIRPVFVFFSAMLCGEINEKTYRAATLIELLHTATLVHDDIVDDSNERRSFFSINALWKNKIAVLVGDFLLSKGMLISVQNKDFELLNIVSNSVKEMSEGELLQIEKARRLDIEENIYFEIIRKKTASLIASCCACGASSADANQLMVDKMYKFGELTGIAFQLKDDLFDYEITNQTGKPHGIDIKEKKMTLPLIYMLQTLKSSDRKRVINIVKNYSNNNEKVNEVIKQVNESGGIAYTKQKMLEYKQSASDVLNDFPDCQAKDALNNLLQFITERKK